MSVWQTAHLDHFYCDSQNSHMGVLFLTLLSKTESVLEQEEQRGGGGVTSSAEAVEVELNKHNQ